VDTDEKAMTQIRELHRRVMNMIARGVVAQSDDAPGMQRVQVSLLHEEQKVAVERLQNYGFSGHAPRNSEVVVVFLGGGRDHGVIVGTDDRSSRMTGLAEGEVAVYTDEGDSIVLRRNNTMEVTTKNLIINATESVKIDTPETHITGSLQVDGAFTMGESAGLPDAHTLYGTTRQRGNIYVDGEIMATGAIQANRPLPSPLPAAATPPEEEPR
jgi:phage baseplate assembly protein V